MKTIIRLFSFFLTMTIGPLVFVFGTLAVLLGYGSTLPSLLGSLASAYASAVNAIPSVNIGPYYSFANAITPLSETLVLLGTLLAVALVAAMVRIVKGIIPTYG